MTARILPVEGYLPKRITDDQVGFFLTKGFMTLNTEQIGDVVVVLMPEGALDAGVAPEFKAAAAALVAPGAKVVFDLSTTRFVDSSGLGAIVSTLRKLHEVKGDVRLCCLNKPVRALFELVRMHKVFEIFNTREDAVNSYGA